ncbi:Cold shock protein CspA [Candidatus Cyrtobacter comes]|uniref:Cold shock-like protein CspA n=1 Tax=Candidatus Cyrtobacter comes TaxID=675776 RepID=A0ABU5L9A2_9RICK|nr:cold shock domain-containing protein [Candidatus Cyrtobacter comes]MDZ5762701.1 Cold shock protein CspA [Candidatus Cyrtobacter comes]
MKLQGTIKWFDPTKGYGFIEVNGKSKDVFVHISEVGRAGISTSNFVNGQKVEFEIAISNNKESAKALRLL